MCARTVGAMLTKRWRNPDMIPSQPLQYCACRASLRVLGCDYRGRGICQKDYRPSEPGLENIRTATTSGLDSVQPASRAGREPDTHFRFVAGGSTQRERRGEGSRGGRSPTRYFVGDLELGWEACGRLRRDIGANSDWRS
jgi:hypothetical protein